jgi:hypothetical protein
MRAEDFSRFIDRRPFEPIRVTISSGETVDLRHPEQVLLMPSMFAFATGPRKGVVTDHGWYNLAHVVKVSPLSSVKRRGPRRQSSA